MGFKIACYLILYLAAVQTAQKALRCAIVECGGFQKEGNVFL